MSAGARPASLQRGRGRRLASPGFTLIEVLVVIAIIVILIGIALPALNMARNAAEVTAVQQMLGGLDIALKAYHADHDVYPRSRYVGGGATPVEPRNPYSGGEWEGAEIVCQALIGYMPDDNDDQRPAMAGDARFDDGAQGLGFRVPGSGRVYGPYFEARDDALAPRWDKNEDSVINGAEIWTNGGTVRDGAFVFADLWGTPVLYYQALPRHTAGLYGRTGDESFGDSDSIWSQNGRFDTEHNDTLVGIVNKHVSGGEVIDVPDEEQAGLRQQMRSAEYMLISPGPNAIFGVGNSGKFNFDDLYQFGP